MDFCQIVVRRIHAAHMHERFFVILTGKDFVDYLCLHFLRPAFFEHTSKTQLTARDFEARFSREASTGVLKRFQAAAALIMPKPRL